MTTQCTHLFFSHKNFPVFLKDAYERLLIQTLNSISTNFTKIPTSSYVSLRIKAVIETEKDKQTQLEFNIQQFNSQFHN